MTIEAPCDGAERISEHVWEGRREVERLGAGSNYTLDGLFSDHP